MAVNGSYIQLYIDGQPIFMGKSGDESAKNNLIEITSKQSGGNAEFMYGKFEYEGTAEGLFAETPVNLLTYNTTVNNAAWIKTGCTVTDNDDSDQNGQELAATVAGWNSTDELYQAITGINGSAITYTFSVWLKGTGTVRLFIQDSAPATFSVVTLTSTLTRYSVSFTSTGDASGIGCGFSRNTDTATGWVMASAMLNVGSSALEYKPSSVMFNALFTAINTKATVTALTGSFITGSQTFSGSALISDLKRTDAMEDAVTYSLTYKITGAMTPTTI